MPSTDDPRTKVDATRGGLFPADRVVLPAAAPLRTGAEPEVVFARDTTDPDVPRGFPPSIRPPAVRATGAVVEEVAGTRYDHEPAGD